MRNLLLLFAVLLVFQGCKEEKRTDYVINGKAEGVYNGIRVFLNEVDPSGKQRAVDTAIVMNEVFNFIGSVKNPSLYTITANGVSASKTFMLENSKIEFNLNKSNMVESEIKGSKSNKYLEAYHNMITSRNDEARELMKEYRLAGQKNDTMRKDSIYSVMKEQRAKTEMYAIEFVKENPNAFFSLNLLNIELNKPNNDISKLEELFSSLSDNIKQSPEGIILNNKIQQGLKEKEKLAHLEIGKIAPNFTAPNPDGKNVSLTDIKGKVTIIDFWAAWCGPCRRENPNVVKVYEKFHNKGLEIIGVSLDGNSRQQDPKKAWLDAIEKDKLKWHHVSNLNYFNEPVAKLYNIQSIPATFILDEDGKIVAKNLRGKALENKIQELLEKS